MMLLTGLAKSIFSAITSWFKSAWFRICSTVRQIGVVKTVTMVWRKALNWRSNIMWIFAAFIVPFPIRMLTLLVAAYAFIEDTFPKKETYELPQQHVDATF